MQRFYCFFNNVTKVGDNLYCWIQLGFGCMEMEWIPSEIRLSGRSIMALTSARESLSNPPVGICAMICTYLGMTLNESFNSGPISTGMSHRFSVICSSFGFTVKDRGDIMILIEGLLNCTVIRSVSVVKFSVVSERKIGQKWYRPTSSFGPIIAIVSGVMLLSLVITYPSGILTFVKSNFTGSKSIFWSLRATMSSRPSIWSIDEGSIL